jgi:hypothetical protein
LKPGTGSVARWQPGAEQGGGEASTFNSPAKVESHRFGGELAEAGTARGHSAGQTNPRRVLADRAEIFEEWWRLVVEHEVRVSKVYDARKPATVRVQGDLRILTCNLSDFDGYSEGIA